MSEPPNIVNVGVVAHGTVINTPNSCTFNPSQVITKSPLFNSIVVGVNCVSIHIVVSSSAQ